MANTKIEDGSHHPEDNGDLESIIYINLPSTDRSLRSAEDVASSPEGSLVP
ncbi:hypothetical protein T4D_10197 [Trichinella pseudospiralis]|uniref:Uncharacterized protein n=1 Tax=Trichinella pseudospiralis TaxID=6337 RepID=A0A0V1FLM2_TRIPS|nr:hypothetical protein T4D_10197 [Trichinella pseudospiralis]